jgi:asparagine N-glycosylation enzyme membrane subunit Stt3|tara:strand:- start:935 stop:1396 length:462 start_codon:yes stop_codon:yes gene_type:complete
MSLGNTGQAVNAKKFQVFIGTTDTNEWALIQNARVLVSHPIFREPTTNGGVVTYTGAPDNSISGTVLFTRDEWTTATNGFGALIGGATGAEINEVPAKSWNVKFTDVSGSGTVVRLTFSNCKLSSVDISKSIEGAVKADIQIVCPGEPTTATS